MLCNICTKNPATVHLTEIIDGQMSELHICEECARKKSQDMEQQFGLSDLLAGMADFDKPKDDSSAGAVLVKCPSCQLTYADFKKIGRLGCGEWGNTFRKYLGPLLKRIHGSTQHTGKTLLKAGRPSRKKADVQELRNRLNRAIESEAFEEAAKIRDQIKELEKRESEKNQ